MSNKITGKDLQKLIGEAMMNEIAFNQFKKLYDREAFKAPLSTTQYAELGDADDFSELASVAGSPTDLTREDIQFYNDNLDKITTKVESRLLALKYFPGVEYFKSKQEEIKDIKGSSDPDDLKAKELSAYHTQQKEKIEQRDAAREAYLKHDDFLSDSEKDRLGDEINNKRSQIAAFQNAPIEQFRYIQAIESAKFKDLKTLSSKKPLAEKITIHFLGELNDDGVTRNSRKKPKRRPSNSYTELVDYKKKLDASLNQSTWIKSKGITKDYIDHINEITQLLNNQSSTTSQIQTLNGEVDDLEEDLENKKTADKQARRNYDSLKNQVEAASYKTLLRKDDLYAGKTKAQKEKRSEIYSKVNKLVKEAEYEQTIDWLENDQNKRDLNDLKNAAINTLNKFYDEIDKTAKKDQTAFGKRFITAQGDFGEFDEADVSLVKRFFDQEIMSERIKKIADISKNLLELSNNNAESEDSPSEFLSKIQLMDLITSVAKQYDSGAGAYVFEYFLALIAGGNVEGKATTDAGKMGAADLFYKTDKGRYGSAKFVKSGTSEQAIGGFVDLYNKAKRDKNLSQNEFLEVEYVITVKKSDFVGTDMDPQNISENNEAEEQDKEDNSDSSSLVSKRGVSSDPSKIIALVVWTPIIKFKPSEEGPKFFINDTAASLTTEGKHIKLNIGSMGSPAGTIYITRHRTETFKEMLVDTIEDQKFEIKSAFKALQEYMEHLKEAETNARIYTTQKPKEGEPVSETPANKTFESLAKAEKAFENLVTHIGYGHGIVDPDDIAGDQLPLFPTSKKVQSVQNESKITPDALKKIIEESFKR